MIFVATNQAGEKIEYRDTKRWLWLLSVFTPAVPILAAFLYWVFGNPWISILAPAFYFLAIPALDMVFGVNNDNPPEDIIEQLSADPFYRRLLFLSIPVFYLSFLVSITAANLPQTPFWAFLLFALGSGISSGVGINVGHELGHKQNRLDKWGAKIILALTGYAHFSIEHNRGHHLMVATPEDAASAKYGENFYRFIAKEIPVSALNGLRLERQRLQKKGLPFWNIRNEILQGYAITLAIAAVLTFIFGFAGFLFIIINHSVGWLQLSLANYVEHYGLMREKKPNGRYGPCEPRHSWNTNHIVSNLMLFHLQRHSDHHANPMRPYQSLRNFEELPNLPSGYPGCYLMALVPPLWFSVMNPKVVAWAKDDLEKINRLPQA